MTTIKKLFIAVALPFYIFLSSMPIVRVKASTDTYARILCNDLIIYQDANLTQPIFALPYSYYVKVETQNATSIKISFGNSDGACPQIIGYVSLNKLTFVDYVPINPYPQIKVSTDVSDVLFNDFEQKNPYFNVPMNEVMYYYGEINNQDQTLCYVYYFKKLGYIDKSSLNPFSVSPHPDKIIIEEDEGANDGENENDSPTPSNAIGENLQIVIIIGISIISISVVYFLFKPSKNKVSDEQNEFSGD